jgi:hypothetical protein
MKHVLVPVVLADSDTAHDIIIDVSTWKKHPPSSHVETSGHFTTDYEAYQRESFSIQMND